MKGLNRIAIGMGLLLALGVNAYAQQPPAAGGAAGGARQGRQGGRGGANLATLPISAIDAVITLTDDEKTKITKIQEDYKTAAKAAADPTARQEATKKATEDIQGVLTSDQKTKWTETMPTLTLIVQSRAIPASVLGDVKLTADQWTKLKAAATETNDKIKALAPADRRTGRAPLLADFKTTVEGLLTADQKAIIEKAPKPAAPGAPAAL